MVSIIKKKISTITYLPAKLDNHEIDKNLTFRENLKHINQNNMTITSTIDDMIKEMISRIAAAELRVKADVAVDAVKEEKMVRNIAVVLSFPHLASTATSTRIQSVYATIESV